MSKNKLKYRLYAFVPYNISEIQKGIQAGHAALEYAAEYGNTDEYKDFVNNDKTWIILNGGTTRNSEFVATLGDMNVLANKLTDLHVNYSVFYEPDLNHALTGIAFLTDERVWDIEKYPNFEPMGTLFSGFISMDLYIQELKGWEDSVGGKKNAALREFLADKHLA
jgi:hypothetical protein